MSTRELQRTWDAARPVDVLATLGPLRRGTGDPAHRVDDAGRFWWACTTPAGPGTVAIEGTRSLVRAQAWGAGAAWLLDRLPALLGADDDWAALDVSAVPALRETRRGRAGVRPARTGPGLEPGRVRAGMRLPCTGLVLDALVRAVLEKKVPGVEARRSWRELVRRFGEPAPGPAVGMFVPPTPGALLEVPAWDWHRVGVDLRRQRTIRGAAGLARRLGGGGAVPPGQGVGGVARRARGRGGG